MAGLMKLTEARVRALRPQAKRYQVGDPECPGLYMRIAPSGAKTWTIVTRDPVGKQVWRAVEGALVGDPLGTVRDKAREGIRRIKAGQDPFPPPPQAPETFGKVAEDWRRLHVVEKGLRSRPEVERLLRVHVLPLWKDRDFAGIRRGDVTRLLDDVAKNHGARQADYCLSIVGAIMRWHARRADDYTVPLVSGMGRRSAAESARERILEDHELRALWPALDASGSFGAMVKLLLLTGQRREKVASMRWADIALETGVWTIASDAREKGNAGELALPEMARAVLCTLPRVSGNEYVFAGRGAGHFRGYGKAKVVLDKLSGVSGWTLHDCRRTARSLLSRAKVRPDIAERVLGHKIGGVERIYDRHQYLDEKQHALAALAGLIERIVNLPADNVVELAGRG